MSRENLAIFSLTVTAVGALTAHHFVGHTGSEAASAGNALGVARADAAIGADVAVDVLGTALVEAGAAIAAGAAVQVDATGRAITLAAGQKVGRMAPGAVATQAGDLVEIVLIPN